MSAQGSSVVQGVQGVQAPTMLDKFSVGQLARLAAKVFTGQNRVTEWWLTRCDADECNGTCAHGGSYCGMHDVCEAVGPGDVHSLAGIQVDYTDLHRVVSMYRTQRPRAWSIGMSKLVGLP